MKFNRGLHLGIRVNSVLFAPLGHAFVSRNTGKHCSTIPLYGGRASPPGASFTFGSRWKMVPPKRA